MGQFARVGQLHAGTDSTQASAPSFDPSDFERSPEFIAMLSRMHGQAGDFVPNLIIGGARHPLEPGDYRNSVVIDGKPREFEIHVPPNYDQAKPMPVIYMVHGLGGNIEQMKHETGMNKLADERGMIVVYTQALPKDFPGSLGYAQAPSWNLTNGSLTEPVPGYDDISYFKRVDQLVSQQLNVDDKAKYIAGFSEGGGAAQYVAERMDGTFAAIASVHGTHLVSDANPQPHSGIAFLAIHGDSDHMLPLEGGRGLMSATVPKARESRPLEQKEVWAQANDCSAPKVTQDGKNSVTEYTCKNGDVKEIIRHGKWLLNPISIYKHRSFSDGGAHAWDGKGQTGLGDYGWALVGMPDQSENTSKDVADFFASHRKPDGHLAITRHW